MRPTGNSSYVYLSVYLSTPNILGAKAAAAGRRRARGSGLCCRLPSLDSAAPPLAAPIRLGCLSAGGSARGGTAAAALADEREEESARC